MCKFEIFDFLLNENFTITEIASIKKLEPKLLKSILDMCVSMELIKFSNNKYSLSRNGKVYLKSANSWHRDYLMVWGDHLNSAFTKIPESLLTENNSFNIAHNSNIWDFYKNNPDSDEIFVKFMNGVTDQAHIPQIIDEININNASNILDVGGGIGKFGCAIANKYPSSNVTIFDQDSNKVRAEENISKLSKYKNCLFHPGNMLSEIPKGFNLYTIKHVLHDWNDQGAQRILQLISESMDDFSDLMIIEGLIDRDFDKKSIDGLYLQVRNIEQSVWTPGRVRSTKEFNTLLKNAGLEIKSITNSEIFDISFILCKKSNSCA